MYVELDYSFKTNSTQTIVFDPKPYLPVYKNIGSQSHDSLDILLTYENLCDT